VKPLRALYFDCFSGVSGDMILGALIDLGVNPAVIRKALKTLDLKGYKFKTSSVQRGLIAGSKAQVIIDRSSRPVARKFSDIKKIISGSGLSSNAKKNSLAVLERIAQAESVIHKIPIEKIHFHEVGAVDSIIDIVGGVVALEALQIDKIYCSSLNVGEGFVECDHGRLPVPAPATLKLLKGIPSFSNGVKRELTTPTGAAMLGYFVDSFGSLPSMKILGDGYGAGDHVIPEIPNLLRVVLGEMSAEYEENLVLIESNIDDMNPEFYEGVMESLFKAGALDVYLTPIIMKKNRPAHKISVLTTQNNRQSLSDIILHETTSFGVRFHSVGRTILDREIKTVKTEWGLVKVKIGQLNGQVIQVSPEYGSCKSIASKRKASIREVYDQAMSLALGKYGSV
jgi:pyridinium-3,5-bisthiocarboxylic acid mononucleotide nickel chelatase